MNLNKPKIISIHELGMKNSPYVYVINTSEHQENERLVRGAVCIPIKTANGSIMAKVPNTWIPIDLSLTAPKEDITKSLDFRKAINNNNIQIVDEEWAIQVLGTEDAKMEATRLVKQNNMSSANLVVPELKQEEEKINPLIIEFLSGTEEEGTYLDESSLYSSLLNNANSFKKEDWSYVIEHTEYEKVKELCLREMNKLANR